MVDLATIVENWEIIQTFNDFNVLVEPLPGSYVILEHHKSCETLSKIYPPNTTLVVNNECGTMQLSGDIKKFYVVNNKGHIWFGGNPAIPDTIHRTEEVTIKHNDGTINISNSVTTVDVEELKGTLYFNELVYE